MNQPHTASRSSRPPVRRPRLPWGRLLWATALGLCGMSVAQAQIRTDGSLGHAPQSLVGPAYVIPQTLGLVSGPNLFQSFSTFNLNVGEAAYFLTTSPGIANIISRVTGGSPSLLDGNINVFAAFGAPNFFFLNPAGVTFGAGASVNVPAAIHISTANYLKFSDGQMYTDLGHVSTFSTQAPEAFGFLGTSRATLNIGNGTFIGQAGAPITLTAGDIVVDNSSVATFGGGDVRVAAVGSDAVEIPLTGSLPAVHGNLTVSNGGSISANATALDSGNVTVSAGNITIDSKGSNFFTGIYTDTPAGSTGNAGVVQVNATGALAMTNYGYISSTTESGGNAAGVAVSVAGPVSLTSGSQIYSGAYSTGNAGPVQLAAANLTIDGAGGILGVSPSGVYSFASAGSGNASSVGVTVSGALSILNTGFISANTYTIGNGGTINVAAQGNLILANGGNISADAIGPGAAGSINVSAANILLEGTSTSATGISTNSELAQSGPAGRITVTTPGSLTITGGANINSQTGSGYDAGSIVVRAGSLTINGQNLPVQTGISTNALFAQGGAGSVSVAVAGPVAISNGGAISSDSDLSNGNAGQVSVTAQSLSISGEGFISSSVTSPNPLARGGNVDVSVNGLLALASGGEISADTFWRGDAGAVQVKAGDIVINGGNLRETTGITSQSEDAPGAANDNAGSVSVVSRGDLALLEGGSISSSTNSPTGRAGSVAVAASNILVDGFLSSIDAESLFDGSGQTGNVTVTASNSIDLTDRGEISVANAGTVANPALITPTLLSVSAPDISLSNNAQITAVALGNTRASDIRVQFGQELSLDPSAISTDSRSGDGGSVTIVGGTLLQLNQSSITTSVFGGVGNGGNISISASALVMNSGFIQANTLGVKALGGDVSINVAVLIPSGSSLFVGGTTPYVFAPDVFGFNVIQAAAPTGLSGTIQITNPALNLSSSLSVLSGKFQATSALGRDRCRNGNGSSLAQGGRGGFAASARDLARAGDSDLLVGGPKAALAVDPGTLFLASLGMECPD